MDLQRTELIDYAKPLLNLEQLIKKISDLCLEGEFEEALALAPEIGVEGRILQHTLRIMEEKELHRYANPHPIQAGQEDL